MREITRYFAALLIGPALIIAGLVVDSSFHATGHEAHLLAPDLLWFVGLLMLLIASVRMFLVHVRLAGGPRTSSRQRRRFVRTATFSLYIGIAGAGLLLLAGILDMSWHHDHRLELDVFSALHPYHALVLVGLVANTTCGVRLFTSQAELSSAVTEELPSTTLGPHVTPAPSGPLTILFTDMESSTTLTQRLGDAAAQEIRHVHNDIVRSSLASNSGAEIKHTGDGIMASFTTASSALDCAIAVQRGVAAHKDQHPDSPLGVYIGLNAGEPISEEEDLFGTSVDLAARICDHAQPGQILASNVIRELVAGKGFLFSDIGETELRSFEDPVKLWELSWQAEGSP